MYLLTFATIIIGMIGIYAQVLAAQTARIAAGQTGLASTMLMWHDAAISEAGDVIDNNPAGYVLVAAAGCSLTAHTPPGFAVCPHGGNGAAAGTVTTAAGTQINRIYNTKLTTPQYECVRLQPICNLPTAAGCTTCSTQYNLTTYEFYSVLYKDSTSGADYVVTYVPPPAVTATNPAPGFITLAGGGNMIGFTLNDLMQQMRQRKMPVYAYGSVVGGKLKPTNTLISGSQYTLPVAIPNGSLAVIASPDGL